MTNDDLNKIREQKKISYNMLEQLTGITKSTLQRYLSGSTRKIPHDALTAISNALGVPVNCEESSYTLPVVGLVKGGIPNLAEQEIIDYETVPHTMADTGDYFALKISGNSMAPRINDGDIVIVKRQSEIKNGEVAVVRVGCEATCKKVYYHNGSISLISNNNEYPPMFYSDTQVERLPVIVLGKVVELRARFNF